MFIYSLLILIIIIFYLTFGVKSDTLEIGDVFTEGIEMQECLKCGVEKPTEDFYPAEIRRSIWICKLCKKEAADKARHKRRSMLDQEELNIRFMMSGLKECIRFLNSEVKDIHYALDHVVPLHRGGTNSPSNLAIISHLNNTRKGTRKFETFKFNLYNTYKRDIPVDDRLYEVQDLINDIEGYAAYIEPILPDYPLSLDNVILRIEEE